ncbi:MAG: alkaline phosphatase family protein [Candidatus Brocadiales bacterium]|nr:alkaline phosphatase family protein [Candidatus Brocadiales bacterium]
MAKKGRRKLLYIVLDGLSDGPYGLKELGGKTPLEAAFTPNMDRLARMGQTGLMHPVGKGIAPESDVAVISILGYDAFRYYTGRGPLESFASGLEIRPGDLALRVNFATRGKGREILDRRVGRNLSTNEAHLLCKEINSQLQLESVPNTFELKNTIGHRAVLVIHPKKSKLSGEITNTDPAYAREGVLGVAKEEGSYENLVQYCKPLERQKDIKGASMAALLVNEFVLKSCELLEASPVNTARRKRGFLPANLLLLRDAGDRLPAFPSIKKKFGKSFACLADMPVERGIALLTGMRVVELPPPTANFKRDYTLRVKKSLWALGKFDGLYVHIKGPDVPGHDGDGLGKKAVIEAIDRFYLAPLLNQINLDTTLISLTADHSTPCQLKSHSSDPVPLVICGGSVQPDGTKTFSEKACRGGSLGEMKGTQLMPLLIRYSVA